MSSYTDNPGSQPFAVAQDWYAHSFGALYPILYAHRSPEEARQQAAFAAEQLRITAGDRLLDLCCGNGRHLGALARYTQRLVGIDYSPELLFIARAQLPPPARLVRGDMRSLPFENAFDALTNFFTSFGYFQAEAENAQVPVQMAQALRPGGRFFMDYVNPDHLKRTLVPHSERTAEGFHVTEDRWIDLDTRRVNKRTRIRRGQEPERVFGESVRLYSQNEITVLLENAGLEIDAMFGDHEGRPVAPEYARMIVVGHRK